MKKIYLFLSSIGVLLGTCLSAIKFRKFDEKLDAVEEGRSAKESKPPFGRSFYHFTVKKNETYNHIVWLNEQYPTVALFQTDANCTFAYDPDTWRNGTASHDEGLPGGTNCSFKGEITIFSFLKLTEVSDSPTPKEYLLGASDLAGDGPEFKVSNSTRTLSFFYVSKKIKVSFRLSNVSEKQKTPPYYAVDSLTNLVSVEMRNLSTDSQASFFELTYAVMEGSKAKIALEYRSRFSDLEAPGTFMDYETLISRTPRQSPTTVFMFWRDVAFSDESRSKSNFISATLVASSDSCKNIFHNTLGQGEGVNVSCFSGTIRFEALNQDDMYSSKGLIIWESLVGFKDPIEQGRNILGICVFLAGYIVPLVAFFIALLFVYGFKSKDFDYESMLSESDSSLE